MVRTQHARIGQAVASEDNPVDRRWQMRRLGTGSYLLPANTVEQSHRFYRLHRWEDGPHLGVERRRTVWTVFTAYEWDIDHLALELPPWDMKEWTELGNYDTRADAIAAALRHDQAQP